MDVGVAAGAWCQLVRSCTHPVNRGVCDPTVALAAQRIDARHIQQPRVLRSMGSVAAHATFGLDCGVLVDKGPACFGMAFGADRILVSGGLQVVIPEGSVSVVAIAAFHCAFIHLVVEGHIERRLYIRVALEAKGRLRSLQQRFFLAAVNVVAAQAAYIGLGMR